MAANTSNNSTKTKVAGDTAAIIDRLKLEGDLIRNSGTNSLKSIKKELVPLLSSIEKNIQDQTSILKASLRSRRLAKTLQSINSLNNVSTNQTTTQQTTVLTQNNQNQNNTPKNKNKLKLSDIMDNLNPGNIISKSSKVAFFTAIAPAVGSLASNMIFSIGKDLNIPDGATQEFAKAANIAGIAGSIGTAFGAKWGLKAAMAGGAASLGSSFGDQVLSASGLDTNKIVTIFGEKMKISNLAEGIFGSMSGAIGLAFASPTVWKGLFTSEQALADLKAAGKSTIALRAGKVVGKIGLGLSIAEGVMSLYYAYGNTAAKWLQDQGMPKDVSKISVKGLAYAAEGASIGAMFGPEGALIGAVAGFAIVGGEAIYNYINDQSKNAVKNTKKKIDAMNKATEDKLKTGDVAGAISTTTLAAQRSAALSNLTGGKYSPEQGQADQQIIDNINKIETIKPGSSYYLDTIKAAVESRKKIGEGANKTSVLENEIETIAKQRMGARMKDLLNHPKRAEQYFYMLATQSSIETDDKTKHVAAKYVYDKLLEEIKNQNKPKISSVPNEYGPLKINPSDFMSIIPDLSNKLSAVSTASDSISGYGITVYAPTTVGPMTYNQKGGNSSYTNISAGNGGIDRSANPYGLPKASN